MNEKLSDDITVIKADVKEVKGDVKDIGKVAEQIPDTLKSKSLAETSIPPTTTTEQDLRTAGQRRINMIWEYTQSFIALLLVCSAVIITVFPTLQGRNIEVPDVLTSSLFLVLGFYFGRTNHARIGDEPQRGLNGPLDDRR